MDIEELIEDMRKPVKPIFKSDDYIISNDGKYRYKVISVHNDEQYYNVVNLNTLLGIEEKLYFNFQDNFHIEYRTRYQNLGKSDWFNNHYDNKSISEEEVKDGQTNNDEKTMIFKDILKAPFHTDPYGIYIFSGNDDSLPVLTCDMDNKDTFVNAICDILNGKFVDMYIYCDYWNGSVDVNGGEFGLDVRLFGYLTKCLGLNDETACLVQEDFGMWVVDMINLNNINRKLMHIEENATKFEIDGKNGE